MSDETSTITVTILEKDYQVSCPQDEVEALTASARFLDRKMDEIRTSGKVVGLDRIAVMAALNIANDLLQVRQSEQLFSGDVADRVKSLKEKLEQNMDYS